MKFILSLVFCLVATTFSLPKVSNDLTCPICVDVVTDIDEYLTDETTIEEILELAKQVRNQPSYILENINLFS